MKIWELWPRPVFGPVITNMLGNPETVVPRYAWLPARQRRVPSAGDEQALAADLVVGCQFFAQDRVGDLPVEHPLGKRFGLCHGRRVAAESGGAVLADP